MGEGVSAEDDVRFNSADVCMMIALSNFFSDKRSPKFFRSKLLIAKMFESFPNKFRNPQGNRTDLPSKSLLNLIDKMLYAGFLRIDDDSNEYFFDEDVFDKFVKKDCVEGVDFWEYFDRHVDYVEL